MTMTMTIYNIYTSIDVIINNCRPFWKTLLRSYSANISVTEGDCGFLIVILAAMFSF